MPCSNSRFQLPRFYTSMLLEIVTRNDQFVSRTDVELGGVELRGQVDIELAKQVDVELAGEVDVEVGKDVDIEAEPVRVDTKLDTSGN